MVEKLPKQLHAVLGEEFQIICAATNDQDAPMGLMFSWITPNGVQFISIVDDVRDDGLTATSTLNIDNITHNHHGIYQCTVSNGEHQGNNISITTNLIVEGESL